MGVSKAQVARVTVTCICGCGETFSAFPVYRPKSEGGGLRVPDYKRGHHPNCRATQTSEKPAWNAGMKKGEHPSLERMGFQDGVHHWNYDETKNPDWFSPDFDHVAFARAYGNLQRSRGTRKVYGKFRDAILKRDGYACTKCGFQWAEGMHPHLIHVHHQETIKASPDRTFDDENVTTLCRECHLLEHHGHKRTKRLP